MVLAAGCLLAFVAATNRWLDWGNSLRLVQANDEFDYRAIAAAAPRFPSARLQNQHAQRFVLHYLIGLLGRAFGIDAVYAVATGLTVLACVVVLMFILRTLGVSTTAAVLCLAVFILNPYSIRYYLIARGEITDLGFDLGVLISLSGLLARRYPLVLAGTIVAALDRQTELPAALVLGVCVYVWPGAGESAPPQRLGRAIGPPVIAVIIYVLEVHVARSFSFDTTPGFMSFTVLGELKALPSGAGALGQHVLRSVNGLFSVGVLIIVGVAGLRSSGGRRRWRPPAVTEFWACLAVGLAIALQALALSASYAEHNETRLSVLALGSLVCALAVLLGRLEQQGQAVGPGVSAGVIGVLAIGSFHHLYTVIGPANAHQSVVLQAVAAVVVGAIVRFGATHRAKLGDGRR